MPYTPKADHWTGGRGTVQPAPPLVFGLLACEGFLTTLVQVQGSVLAFPELQTPPPPPPLGGQTGMLALAHHEDSMSTPLLSLQNMAATLSLLGERENTRTTGPLLTSTSSAHLQVHPHLNPGQIIQNLGLCNLAPSSTPQS